MSAAAAPSQSRRPGHQPDRRRPRRQPLLPARLRHDAADRAPGGRAQLRPRSACWRASSTACRASARPRRASPSTASARGRSWPAGSLASACAGPDSGGAFLRGLCRHRRDRRTGQLRLPSCRLRAAQRLGESSSRLGRAFSIHGVGGSLGWAAAPVMYFLDSMFGWVDAALIGAHAGPRCCRCWSGSIAASWSTIASRRAPRRPRRHDSPCVAVPAARDPALPRLTSRWSRPTPSASSSSPCRPGPVDVRRQRELRGALPDRLHRRLGGRHAGGRLLRRPGASPRPGRDAGPARGRRLDRADREPRPSRRRCCCRCWPWPARRAASPIRRAT